LSAKNVSGEALSMEASREFSRTPPRLPPCSDVSVFQKTRMSQFWDTHHNMVRVPKMRHTVSIRLYDTLLQRSANVM